MLDSRESLGNAVYKLPFYRALKRAYPGCDITLIVSAGTAAAGPARPVLAPFLDHVIAGTSMEGRLAKAVGALRGLGRFDIVFDTRTKVLRVLTTRLFLRHGQYVTSLPGYALTTRRRHWRLRPKHWVARAMSMIDVATGKPADWDGEVILPDAARLAAAALLPDPSCGYIGLCCGAAHPYKVWPTDRFNALARRIADRGWQPVFMIGPKECAMAADLRRAVPGALFPEIDRTDGYRDVDGPLLALALGERLTAAVSSCTGIGHLLANAKTPLLSLFGPTDPRRFLAWVSPIRALRAQDFGGKPREMAAIPVDAAMDALESLVAASKAGPGDPRYQALRHPYH